MLFVLIILVVSVLYAYKGFNSSIKYGLTPRNASKVKHMIKNNADWSTIELFVTSKSSIGRVNQTIAKCKLQYLLNKGAK